MGKKNKLDANSPKKDSIQLMIENYKSHIAQTQLKDEVYKWQLF